jgi:copper chaperone CopZ
MEQATLSITGMTCGGCAASVTRVLTKLDGVASAQVDLAAANAKVSFDPQVVNLDDLKRAIQGAGFGAA